MSTIAVFQAVVGYLYLKDWRMRTKANLTVRQNTGKINSSPVSAMQPVVKFSYGCYYTLKIPGKLHYSILVVFKKMCIKLDVI